MWLRAGTIRVCLHLEQLIQNHDGLKCEPKVCEYKQGAIILAKNPVYRQRCKHEDRSVWRTCQTINMVADVLTKSAAKPQLMKFDITMFGKLSMNFVRAQIEHLFLPWKPEFI